VNSAARVALRTGRCPHDKLAAVPDSAEDLDEVFAALRTGPNDSPETLTARFESFFPWYEKFLEPWLPTDKASRMLDVPCGTGNLLYALWKLGYTALSGSDSESRQVDLARRLGLPATADDAFAVVEALSQASVAPVFSLDFLEHLDRSRALDLARLVCHALSRGGYFLCRMPSADGPFGSSDRHNDLTLRRPRIEIVQEAPVRYKWPNVLRRAWFDVTTKVLGLFLDLGGIGAPRVWTRSMWVMARKSA
jgi:SAM-dependent methyltransferase